MCDVDSSLSERGNMDFTDSLRTEIREIVREELAKSQPDPTTTLISTSDAGERVGVTERTIRRWIHGGRLTAIKAGRVVRVDPAELDKLVRRDGRVRGTANGGSLKNGNQAARDLTPEEMADRDCA